MFRKAAAIASVVPEPMQEAAFHRALDVLQQEQERSAPESSKERRTAGKNSSGKNAGEAHQPDDSVIALHQLSRTNAADVDAQEGALLKSLALLRVAERELGIERLSAPQIAAVLTDKFRWKVSRRGVSMALDSAGRLVDRRKDGRAVSYRLMAPGEQRLDNQPAAVTDPTATKQRSSTRRPKTANRAPQSEPSDTAKKGSTQRGSRKQGTRVGPKEAVEQLIVAGFFKSPQTISSIREQLEQSRAIRYKATDMSPALVRLLRDGKLSRGKNADGQYEYIAPGA